MIQLREFKERDAAVLQQKQTLQVGLDEITDMIRAWQTKTFDGKRFEMFAVLADDTVVGSVSLYERCRSAASVGIEIFADERGKGYASEAMKRIAETARNSGYRVILDQVAVSNKPSISLHEKLGFETDGYVYTNAKGHAVLLWLLCL